MRFWTRDPGQRPARGRSGLLQLGGWRFGIALIAFIVVTRVVQAEEPPIAGHFGDDYFAAGGAIKLSDVVSGDGVLAGGIIESNVSIAGDALIAGGQVAVRATVGDDLYAAGRDIEVDALIGSDAWLSGGRVNVAPESRIDGRLTIAAGQVTLGGRVRGDVRVYANELTVLPGTRVDGRLLHRAAGRVWIAPDVQIGGGSGKLIRPVPRGDYATPNMARPAGTLGWLGLAGLGVVGLVVMRLFPGFSARASAVLSRSPWRSLGAGLLLLVGVPIAAVAMFVTIIGIPAAVGVLLLYVVVLVVAYVIGAQFVGDLLLVAFRSETAARTAWRISALMLALLALSVIAAWPVIGGFVRFAVLLLGLGACVLARSARMPAGTAPSG